MKMKYCDKKPRIFVISYWFYKRCYFYSFVFFWRYWVNFRTRL